MRIPRLALPTFGRDRARRAAFRHIVARADHARDEGRHADAATLYAEALALGPHRGDLHVQLGNMLKEAGDHARAERAYDDAAGLLPGDADLALQRGHLFRRAGRLADADKAYRAAQALSPGWDEPARHIEALEHDIAKPGTPTRRPDPSLPRAGTTPSDMEPALDPAVLAPELAPQPSTDLTRELRPGVDMRSLGRREHGAAGNRQTLRGVCAIRGVCRSVDPIVEVQLLLDDVVVCSGAARGGYPLAPGDGRTRLRKFVFNLWHDFSGVPAGSYAAELRCRDAEGRTLSFRDALVVAPPLREQDHPGSDGVVDSVACDPAGLEHAIRSRASMVRAAERRLFAEEPRTVLVMRTDQLGDLIASLAAIRRLRELLPHARLIALLTAANAELGRTLGLFDEVIVVDFPDDPVERRRIMPLAAQEALRRRLEPYRFDLAIDLSEAALSRPLLLLSGAPFLYGVGGGDWPWLNAAFNLATRDRANGLDVVPHSAKTLALIESLGATMRDSFRVMRRDDLARDRLARFGLDGETRFVVLHMGARIAFSRWPGFRELAATILARTDRTVVLITEEGSVRPSLPPELIGNARFRPIGERLPFDDFDALISFAEVLVGNDSGPKHLAALRGTPVVTLFTARINWNEWGQEQVGTIISRRVPCAGCAIFHDAEECGKDFACIVDIRVEEVFAAMRLGPARP